MTPILAYKDLEMHSIMIPIIILIGLGFLLTFGGELVTLYKAMIGDHGEHKWQTTHPKQECTRELETRLFFNTRFLYRAMIRES